MALFKDFFVLPRVTIIERIDNKIVVRFVLGGRAGQGEETELSVESPHTSGRANLSQSGTRFSHNFHTLSLQKLLAILGAITDLYVQNCGWNGPLP